VVGLRLEGSLVVIIIFVPPAQAKPLGMNIDAVVIMIKKIYLIFIA